MLPCHQLESLIERSMKAGIKVETIIGDTANTEKGNVEYTHKNDIDLVAKLNPAITQGKKEDEFEFNKDAGMYDWKARHLTIRKERRGKNGVAKNQADTYDFDVEKMESLPAKRRLLQTWS